MSIELPKHYKETQISKPEAIGTGIANSAKTATNYIQADLTGIRIANANPATATTYQHQTATNTEFVVDGVSRAEISGDGARFGKEYVEGATDNESHMELDFHSQRMIDRDGNEYFKVEDLRDESGKAEVVDTFTSNGTRTYYPLELDPIDRNYSVDVSDSSGGAVTKRLDGFVFETAPTAGAIVTATYYTASQEAKSYTFGLRRGDAGFLSIAEGNDVNASGYGSHAEGGKTYATNSYSHAEGYNTFARGYGSHAEGNLTYATNSYSHAEGWNTSATGLAAHAQNEYTSAAYEAQTVIGKFNVNGSANAFEIGNGSSTNARSNAFTVDWNGNIMARGMAGMVQMFAGSTPPTGWLLCHGQAISRTDYATLFAAIGTTWGSGNGSTTFNIPDLRGRAPIGAGAGSQLSARTLGGLIGEETHSLTANESGLRAHTHSFTQPTVKVKYSKSVASGTAANHIDGSSSSEATAPMVVSGGAVGAVTGGELNGSAHNNMQPSAVVNFIICTGKTS